MQAILVQSAYTIHMHCTWGKYMCVIELTKRAVRTNMCTRVHIRYTI